MKNWKYIKQSLIINYKTWIALIISSFFVCDYNFFTGIFNYILGLLYIYCGHIFYHSPFSTVYYYIHTYHHDHHDVNGTLFEIIMEFTGTMMPIVIYYCVLNYKKFNDYFNPYVYLFFALFYSTVHIINYTYLKCNNMHMQHHKNIDGNYFPDICDLIFDTKHDPSDVENTDHWLLNILFVTLFVEFLKGIYRKNEKIYNLKLLSFIFYGLLYNFVILFSVYYFINDVFNYDKKLNELFKIKLERIKNKIVT